MSQQGPIIVVSTAGRPSFAGALDDAKMFPVIDTAWADAPRAVEQLQPAAVLVAMSEAVEPGFDGAGETDRRTQPYLPLIAIDPQDAAARKRHSVFASRRQFRSPDRAPARRAAGPDIARHRDAPARRRPGGATTLPDTDPARDATVLLIGRGAAYPALSVSLGERMGVVGALSIEAAAKHLNVRDIDGIVLGEGFSARVVDAFLTVLAEDARFRNLPVVVTSDELAPAYDLPNLEIITGEPACVAANALPLIRQHALRRI